MWGQISFSIYFILNLIFFSNSSLAENGLAFSRNARTSETFHSSLVTKGLAHSCLTIRVIPDGLPCNPAMTPFNKNPTLNIEFLLSNGYSSVAKIRRILDADFSQDVVDSLFSEGKIIQIEANADLNFVSKFFNAQYTPISVKGFSVVRNEANPDVELSVVEEEGLLFQTGHEIFENFFAGAQIRFINRKFIKQKFKLIQLGTQEGRDLLKAKTQTITYFEPGISWFSSHKWSPRVSLLLANVGTVFEEHDELKIPVELKVGFGISPPLEFSNLDLTLEYHSVSYDEDSLDKIRLGALFHFGAMYLSGGIDSNGMSGGIYYSLDNLNAGILYSTTRLISEDEEFFTQTVYVQLGWKI